MKSSTDVMRAAGITYRQLNYWVTKGYLEAANTDGLTGSGHNFEFTHDQVRLATLMGELTRAGLTPAAAREAADELRTTGTAHLGPFTLTQAAAA